MKVLLLGAHCRAIEGLVRQSGCEPISTEAPLTMEMIEAAGAAMAVSYGYRHIIRQGIIDALNGRVINMHISLLPWNRGADPNLWSFLEDTPKGASIHYIDRGIDTGDIIAQEEVFFHEPGHTLRTTYQALSRTIESLFAQAWPSIVSGTDSRRPQPKGGSLHYLKDKDNYMHLLAGLGWDTPVARLVGKAKDGVK